MKKKSKFVISIFMLLFTVMGTFCFLNNKVKAAYAPIEETKTVYEDISNSKNKIRISEKGKIDITYQYGYTEVMIVIYPCSDYKLDAKDNPIACNSFSGDRKIIHVGGDHNDEKDDNGIAKQTATKTVHLFNYFDYDEILKVEFIGSFINSKNNDNTGSYKYLFYDADNIDCGYNDQRCVGKESKNERNAHMTVYSRVGRYLCGYSNPLDNLTNYNNCLAKEMKNITLIGNRVYAGNVTSRKDISNSKIGQTIYVKVDNSKVDGGAGDVESLVYDTIIPTLITILFVVAGISIAVLGYKIVKSSDEPQERQESVKRLRNILIGIAFALILLFAFEPISNLVKDYIGE